MVSEEEHLAQWNKTDLAIVTAVFLCHHDGRYLHEPIHGAGAPSSPVNRKLLIDCHVHLRHFQMETRLLYLSQDAEEFRCSVLRHGNTASTRTIPHIRTESMSLICCRNSAPRPGGAVPYYWGWTGPMTSKEGWILKISRSETALIARAA